jgi:WD40 repeat protein
LPVDHDVWSLTFTPDGKHLAAGIGTLRVLDVETGRSILTKSVPSIRPMALSPGGQNGQMLLATGQGMLNDGTVRLWDARNWQERAVLMGHQKLIFSVAFSPDGKRLASASKDGSVKLWSVPQTRAPMVRER